jgi:hypothetical protein
MDVGYAVCGIDLLKGLGKNQSSMTEANTRLLYLRVQKYWKFFNATGTDLATRRKHGRLVVLNQKK